MPVTTNSTEAAQPSVAGRYFSVKFLCLLLSLASLLVYANTLTNSYTLDDATVITENTLVKQGFKAIPELLATPRLRGFGLSNDRESYRPIPMITHAVEYELWGASPGISHAVNLLLFIGCVLALFLFLNKLFSGHRTGIAFVATLLFAVHPIHTEVVANIKSRDELLCFLFAFLSLNAFITYARRSKVISLLIGALMLFLALLSKETAISFLIIIPLIFFFYINENRKRSTIITITAVVIAAGFLAIRTSILGNHDANAITFIANPLVAAPDVASRLATAILALGMYLKLLFIPYPLICDYSYNSIPFVQFDTVLVLLSLVAYIALFITGIYRLIKKPKDPWAFAILFFLTTIAIFSNIPFLIYSELAERFLFFASAGLCIAAALGFEHWIVRTEIKNLTQLTSKWALGSIIPVCLLYSVLTIARNTDWKDNNTLFSADIDKRPNNSRLNYYLAQTISKDLATQETDDTRRKQLLRQSLDLLNTAIAIYPAFDEAHTEAGRIYDNLGMFDSSATHNAKAIAINPHNAIATYNLARAYYAQKKYQDAIPLFKKSIEFKPDYTFAFLNLGRLYIENKQYDSAATYFSGALKIDPSQEMARQALGYIATQKAAADSSGKTVLPAK
jgi:tetratricopeptide (TPR) repeat protein